MRQYTPKLKYWREVPGTPWVDAHIYAEIDMGDETTAVIKAFRFNGKWEYQVFPVGRRYAAIEAFHDLWIAPFEACHDINKEGN